MISRETALKKCGIQLKGIRPRKKNESEDDFRIREKEYNKWLKRFDSLLLDYRAYRAMNPEKSWEFYEDTGRKNENTRILYTLAKEVRKFARTERKKKQQQQQAQTQTQTQESTNV